MLAYNMVAHGGPYWNIEVSNAMIYPNEISALWYYSYNPSTGVEIDVYPYDTIIISDSCFSFYEPEEGTNPTMAKAFVDHEAAAFVGNIIEPWADSDWWMSVFWDDLSQENYNVRNAVIDFCEYWGHGWNLGDEWRIYGNQYATLP